MNQRLKNVANKQAQQATGNAAREDGVKKVLRRTREKDDQNWSFSFQFFDEIKHFGFNSEFVDNKWLTSLLFRLKELSALRIDAVLNDRRVVEGTLRIHDINWSQKNIPITRDNLHWVPEDYRNNPNEFPFMQFAVSRARGRLVGFFDENNTFQIVLLDPLHNAQPSKRHEYVVRLSHPLGCELTSVRHEIAKVTAQCREKRCHSAALLSAAIEGKSTKYGIALVISLDDESLAKDANDLFAMDAATTYGEIVQAGIDSLISRMDNK